MKRNEQIASLYVKRRKSVKEIAEVVSLSTKQVRNILRDQNVVLEGKRRTNGYEIDVDFFKSWTPEMAYVLGFILTDGCVSGNSVTIAQKEREILERIGSAMKSNYPIKQSRNIYTLSISRKSIVEDLAALGITEKKSLTVEFLQVPHEYLHHFIRGVVDGDGWVQDRGYVLNVTSASPMFAYYLHELFNLCKFNRRITKQSGAYRVWVSGKEDVIRLGRWLYRGSSDLYLPRKRERFEINEKRDAIKIVS
jgi:DNA-binding transcriptional regulator WhiA